MYSSDRRPDPDTLLHAARREALGCLRVFLGAAPGVGKTFTMLRTAKERAEEGEDVVIGVVESHGRRDTEALCDGLERLALAPLAYRDQTFHEFDIDAALARRPDILLVDELAHRNIPGSRHPRRYQDIEELLDAGIDVWTTVNVQHLESLNDDVARITGARMRETVPDTLIERARDVSLVDLTPQELLERLRRGKVYVPEQARAAIEGYFNVSNLHALRELAIQTMAERVDADVRLAMDVGGNEGPGLFARVCWWCSKQGPTMSLWFAPPTVWQRSVWPVGRWPLSMLVACHPHATWRWKRRSAWPSAWGAKRCG